MCNHYFYGYGYARECSWLLIGEVNLSVKVQHHCCNNTSLLAFIIRKPCIKDSNNFNSIHYKFSIIFPSRVSNGSINSSKKDYNISTSIHYKETLHKIIYRFILQYLIISQDWMLFNSAEVRKLTNLYFLPALGRLVSFFSICLRCFQEKIWLMFCATIQLISSKLSTF